MTTLIKILLSPLAFAIGFLWPLLTQSMLATGLLNNSSQALIVGAMIAIAFGLLAQFRGSWLWIK